MKKFLPLALAVLLVAAVVFGIVTVGQKNDLEKQVTALKADLEASKAETAKLADDIAKAAEEAAKAAEEAAKAAEEAAALAQAKPAPGPKLGDVRVRQALLYALDRASFINVQYGPELAEVGMAPISPTSWAFPDVSELNRYDFDMDKAAALMDEAGWVMGDDGYRHKDGEKFTIRWLVYTDSPWPGTLSGMAADTWKRLGVDLVIEQMDFNTVAAKTMDAEPGEKDFDIYTMGFSLSIDPDPTGALFDYDAFKAEGFNASGYYNEESQNLIKEGKSYFTVEERAPIYQKWAKLMNEEVPTVIVAYRNEIWGVNNRVKGLDQNAYMKWPGLLDQIELEGDQTLKFGESSFDGVFNPILSSNVYDGYIADSIFESLVKNDHAGVYHPSLADYSLSEDNLTYTFTLKDGVKFSDGTPMTTADIAFTYNTIAHKDYVGPRLYAVSEFVGYKAYAAGEAESISGIEIVDDKTIKFTFETAAPSNIESFIYGILSKDYYAWENWDQFVEKNEAPMGSGLMKMDSWAPSEYVSLVKNEEYWNAEAAAKIAGVHITVVPDESKISALQLGNIDFAQLNASKDNVAAVEALENVSLTKYMGNGYTFMCFNTLH